MSISAMRHALKKTALLALVLTYSTAHASSENLVDIATSNAPVEIIKNKAQTLALTAANQKIDTLENTALDHG
jgi:3-oxoacyl-(acyl-carrier-protein) synthase